MEKIMKRFALFAALLCLAAPATGTAPTSPAQQATVVSTKSFVTLPEIRAPIVDAGQLDGVLRVSIVLQAQDEAAAARLSARLPELNADSLSAAIEFARLYATPFTPVDVEKLISILGPSLTQSDKDISQILVVKVTAMAA